jgi:hypothetical protein
MCSTSTNRSIERARRAQEPRRGVAAGKTRRFACVAQRRVPRPTALRGHVGETTAEGGHREPFRHNHEPSSPWTDAGNIATGFVVIQVVSGSILKRRSHWRPRAVASGTRRLRRNSSTAASLEFLNRGGPPRLWRCRSFSSASSHRTHAWRLRGQDPWWSASASDAYQLVPKTKVFDVGLQTRSGADHGAPANSCVILSISALPSVCRTDARGVSLPRGGAVSRSATKSEDRAVSRNLVPHDFPFL